jgi:MFS family permease
MVFWINVPIGVAVVVMLVLWLHEDLKHRQHRIDYLGALLMVLGSGTLMFAVVQGPHLDGSVFAALLVGAIAVLGLFFLHERRTAEPMLPIALLNNRIIGAGTLGCFSLGAIIMGASAFLSLYVQGVMGHSAIVAGIVLMTPSVTWPIGSSSGGWIMLRTSYRTTCAIGAVPLVAGSLIMILLDPSSGPLFAGIGAGLIGIGMGLTNNTFTVAIQGSVGWAQRGIATSTLSFMRQVGQAIGAAVFGGTINAALAGQGASSDMADRIMDPVLRRGIAIDEIAPLTNAIAHGLHDVYLITGGLCLVVLATALLLPPGLNPLRAQARPL